MGKLYADYKAAYPELAKELEEALTREDIKHLTKESFSFKM